MAYLCVRVILSVGKEPIVLKSESFIFWWIFTFKPIVRHTENLDGFRWCNTLLQAGDGDVGLIVKWMNDDDND